VVYDIVLPTLDDLSNKAPSTKTSTSAVRDGGGASKDFGLGLCHGFINHPWGHCGVHYKVVPKIAKLVYNSNNYGLWYL